MNELVSDSFAELVTIVGSALGSVIFTCVGLFVEHSSVQNVVAGHSAVGFWEMYMGGLALFAGLYLFGYRECWPRLMDYRNKTGAIGKRDSN